MLDINKYVTHPQQYANDPFGHMAELDHWSPLIANRLAAQQGLTLTEEHWQVLYCLREQYRVCAEQWTARQLTRNLERDYREMGGRRYLFQLFPRGPIAQGCPLAGLPVPQDAIDRSFGSVH
jgi:TusE/DsrC/DsvC family sulfur relay protein